MSNAKSEIRNCAGQISFDQNVLGLQVPVGDRRLALGADDRHVQVGEAGGDGEGHVDHLEVEFYFIFFGFYW